jgi:hypothetical protein
MANTPVCTRNGLSIQNWAPRVNRKTGKNLSDPAECRAGSVSRIALVEPLRGLLP